MLKIPLAGDLVLDARAQDLFAAGLLHSAPFARPLSALFNTLMRPDARLSDPAADVTHVARLALMARGRLTPGSPEGRAAVRAGLLHAALQIMERDLHRPGLAPENVASELEVSLRQVHILFEPTGKSFARTLAAMRVERASRLLRGAPSASIADIAYSCGFASLSAFYRAFQGNYGMTPRDLRSMEAEQS